MRLYLDKKSCSVLYCNLLKLIVNYSINNSLRNMIKWFGERSRSYVVNHHQRVHYLTRNTLLSKSTTSPSSRYQLLVKLSIFEMIKTIECLWKLKIVRNNEKKVQWENKLLFWMIERYDAKPSKIPQSGCFRYLGYVIG